MKAIIHVNHLAHQQTHGAAIRAGLARHGIDAEFAPYDDPQPCDFAVVWGWKQKNVIAAGRPILVMERGHVGERMDYTSCGWNGLAGRGRYVPALDGGARWRRLWGDLIRPWRDGVPTPDSGPALLIGQVPGDAALYGLDLDRWAADTAAALQAQGWDVVFRPHPLAVRGGQVRVPAGARRSDGTLSDDLANSAICVTFSSTTGVESALAGVPTIALDAGSMAHPVAGHAVVEIATPDREGWAHDLAWTQFSMKEIEDGFAWDQLRAYLDQVPS